MSLIVSPGTGIAIVRGARLEDSEALCALSAQLGYPSPQSEFTRRLTTLLNDPEQHVVLVAVESERLAGFAHVMYVPILVIDASAQLAGLIVDETLRGRGIGRKLMIAAETWAKSRGCRSLYLKSNILRRRAHRFYARLGYVREKTQYAFIKQLREVCVRI